MMIFSLVAMTGLEKCCITSAYLQWLCHSGEPPVARGPLVSFGIVLIIFLFPLGLYFYFLWDYIFISFGIVLIIFFISFGLVLIIFLFPLG